MHESTVTATTSRPRRTLALSLGGLAAVAVLVASVFGIFTDIVYARETAAWAAQGMGQDWANLLIVVPALLISTVLVARGSLPALHIWRGLLLYVLYSYILYAFFIHFNPLFLVYVAALGCSFYALVASLATSSIALPAELPRARFPAFVLILSAVLFSFMWLAEIIPAVLSGQPPGSLREVGLIVNPVHVLDLALVLPAMAIAATLLFQRRAAGYLLALPLLVFAIVMGVAIEFMFVTMREVSAGAVIMGVIVLLSLAAAGALMRGFTTQRG